MRPNRYIILLSILLGAIGTWFSADAVGQYLYATRSMAAIDVRYAEDSFVWLDSDFENARAEFLFTNDSENEITVVYFAQQIYFDGTFAGAFYGQWEVISVPGGERVSIEVPFFISISEMRSMGGDAELSTRGQMRLSFEGFEREMTVPIGSTIGTVPFEGGDQ